jgi:hypothetical protein
MGPLSPEAVDYLTRNEDQYWRRGGETGVLMNPLKGMIQGEYSWNNTTQAAFGIAAAYGLRHSHRLHACPARVPPSSSRNPCSS